MDTPYEMYDVKHNDHKSRQDKSSTLMNVIHTIPKKIADTAQTQGVSEKFLESGLPSGIINPSLLAHDRYLSAIDAFKDALFITLFLLFAPMIALNAFTITIYILVALYWFFHIAWWEKTKVWNIKASVIKYINNTYRVYWAVFLILSLPLAAAMWYFIFQIGVEGFAFKAVNFVLGIISGAERAFADVFGHIEFVKNNLSINANYELHSTNQEYEYAFVAGAIAFAIITIVAKVLFAGMYKRERDFVAETSEKDLRYAGENALERLKNEA